MESPSPSKVEIIKQAIKQIMEEVESSSNHDDDDAKLLSKLMSQLESLEAEPDADAEGLAFPAVSKLDSTGDDEATKVNSNVSRLEEKEEEEEEEKIAKELKYVKRQNFITHCLLSFMIVVTVAWQISEVSIMLTLKDRVSHPFRSISGLFKEILKPRIANGNEEEPKPSITSDLIETSPVHDLRIPDLPKIDLGFQDEE
ncbi:hypothetical protein L6452_21343 [Arctium lappa]|uniref:Uncharacterized protein n=1 Tax=Arctium lappa TaxID=4217 RepID=A0ACB9BD23_ARCLA|nr:hypothetical protein L6452_21343 [Arctium lappa]